MDTAFEAMTDSPVDLPGNNFECTERIKGVQLQNKTREFPLGFAEGDCHYHLQSTATPYGRTILDGLPLSIVSRKGNSKTALSSTMQLKTSLGPDLPVKRRNVSDFAKGYSLRP